MDKKEKIIQAALTLFVQQGLQATPMSQVAKAAGTGMGTIYNYFSSKEELINAIYKHIKQKEADHIFQGYDNSKSIRQRFEFLYGSLIRYFIENPLEFHFFELFSLSPVITEETRESGRINFAPFFELFEEGQKQGFIKEISIQQMTYFVMGALAAVTRLHVLNNSQIQTEEIKQHLVLAWDAIKN